MRIGNVEGTPQEIKDMFEDQGFNFEDYLGEPYATLNIKWVMIPVLLIIILSIVMAFIDKNNTKAVAILYFFSFAAGIWCTCTISMKFKNTVVTTIAAIGILILISVNSGYIPLKDVPTFIKTITN